MYTLISFIHTYITLHTYIHTSTKVPSLWLQQNLQTFAHFCTVPFPPTHALTICVSPECVVLREGKNAIRAISGTEKVGFGGVAFINIYIYLFIYVFKNIFVYILIFIYLYIRYLKGIFKYIYMCVYIYIQIYIYLNSYMFIYLYFHIVIYSYMY